ncbi:MAG: GIY-YIG nuclease family protein [Acidobacteriota bacterium]|nr:GIY-YIG nuclease family protein [Blastocatellia bacterium]MDW8411843.1 GIY-YIG nuclease family protein [Acidobacteriota bacterium]
MSNSKGFSVRIFIPSGEPEGLRIIEKSNWTGQGLIFPRVLLPDVKRREEIKRTGVYILWGPSESSQLPRVYIGQGDDVLQRIEQHARQKDFWTHAAVFTSKDLNLNRAHVQYIEARLVVLASEAKRAELDNSNSPQEPSLSEADRADAEAFLQDMLLCLPLVGANFFEKAKPGPKSKKDLFIRGKGIEARGVDGIEGFTVRAGSQAVKDASPSTHAYLREMRATLIQQGVLVDKGRFYEFAQDYVFSSPSMAAGVVLGRNANGRIEWKDTRGRTLKEIQEEAK